MQAFVDPDAPPLQLHIMTQEDIDTLVAQFAAAAERATRAGLDGIEIHGGHGYIISEFLSPVSNRRDDIYGGSLENRARLLVDIVVAIRAAVGRDYPLWCKSDSGEFGRAEGISLAEARATAQLLEAAGADAITVTAYHDPGRGALHSESNIPHTPERLVANATAIKNSVSIPVITSGRIEPQAADKHIKAGHFDFLAMGRKMLADPDLPAKVGAGNVEQIRPCVYCYCCVSQIYVLKSVTCAVNPETAYERALIATDRLGGTLQFASIAYPPNERLLNWLRLQTEQSGVDVRLNTHATVDGLSSWQLTSLSLQRAPSAERNMPDIVGGDRDFVFSGDEMRALVLSQPHPHTKRKTSAFTRFMVAAGAKTGITKNPQLVRQG